MPVSILSDADKDHFNRFPNYIHEEDINAFFTLSGSDKREVDKQRGKQNQLGFAMQLCALRYIGFSPDNLNIAPPEIVGYVAEQLKIDPQILTDYGKRIATRTTHLQQIQSYLGFCKANKEDMQALSKWLILRALEHDKPTLLLQLACEKLLKDKIIRPGITQLERIVSNAQNSATKEIYLQLKPLLTSEIIELLDGLLIPNPSTGRTDLMWLRKGTISNSAKEILGAIEKLSFLRKANVDKWSLSCLNPNRQKTLARIGRKGTNQYLQRLVKERRYPILTAFLKQSLVDIVDEIIDMFIQALWDLYQDAKKDLEMFQKSVSQSANEKLKMFREIGYILLNPEVTDANVRSGAFNHIPPDILRQALDDTDNIVRPHGDGHIDFFARRYGYIRQFSPSFLNAFDFKSNSPNDPLLGPVPT